VRYCPGYPAMLVIFVPSIGHLSPIFRLGPEKNSLFSGPHSFKTGHFSNQNRPLGEIRVVFSRPPLHWNASWLG
jgi:hypothetical protein